MIYNIDDLMIFTQPKKSHLFVPAFWLAFDKWVLYNFLDSFDYWCLHSQRKVISVATYLMKRMKLIDLGQLPRALVKWSHPLISPQLGPAALNTLVHDHLTTKNKDRKITSHITPHDLSHYRTSLKCWIFISDRAILNYKKFHQWS